MLKLTTFISVAIAWLNASRNQDVKDTCHSTHSMFKRIDKL